MYIHTVFYKFTVNHWFLGRHLASKINNLNTVTIYVHNIFIILLYVHVKWLVLTVVGLEIEAVAVAVAVAVVGLELCLEVL